MGRPVGVTILAILNFIGAAVCLLGGIAMILGGGFIATMLSQGQGAGGAGILAGLGAAAGVMIIICGGVSALIGFGLWKLKECAHRQYRSLRNQCRFAIARIAWLFGPFQCFCCDMERVLGRGRRLHHLVPAQA